MKRNSVELGDKISFISGLPGPDVVTLVVRRVLDNGDFYADDEMQGIKGILVKAGNIVGGEKHKNSTLPGKQFIGLWNHRDR